MRIGFDARMITHPGIGRYIKCLLPELIRQSPEDEFVLFGNLEKLKGVVTSENVRIIDWNAPIYSVREQISCPFNREDIDLVHIPHFNIPLFCRKRMIVTIHDLIYILFPESVPSPAAKYYASFMMASALRKAERVIAVSNNTREDLVRVFGERFENKITTIYEAAEEEFRSGREEKSLKEIQGRYCLSDKVILYVGSLKPHKNVDGLLEVYARLKEWGIPHQLVIAGRWDKKMDKLKSKLDSDEDIRYIGEVPSEDLAALYNLAEALVHISLYEGFGLTVLEAMQCGTPVVVSDCSSLPEVAGEAALTVSCLNVGQIADTVYNVLINKELSKGMVKAGLHRSKQFSWEKTARETLEIYHGVS